jgi:pSer/pThr/pTyr-binding forkhead associated (FHA) protein
MIRIREPKYTIGRSEGDLRFPLDGRMSSKHVEITHQVVGGVSRWVVTDLQSTHGMFVRVSKTALADGAEILVGNGRYRFESGNLESGATLDYIAGANSGQTQGWDGTQSPVRPPALTELLGREIGNRILLIKGEYWIGSDLTCAIARPDDPFCEPRHVRLVRGSKGGWGAEHNKTQNGLWLRMTQITVDAMIQFQVGEQRFRIRVG